MADGEDRVRIVPSLMCAGICAITVKLGSSVFFSLAVLGFCAGVYGSVSAWLACAVALPVIIVVTLPFLAETIHPAPWFLVVDVTITLAGFTWIMAGNPPTAVFAKLLPGIMEKPVPYVRTLFRFMIVSVVSAVSIVGMFFWSDFAAQTADIVLQLLGATATEGTVMPSAESIIELSKIVMLRGGALLGVAVLLFLSRQFSLFLTRIRRKKTVAGLRSFFAPGKTVWFFAGGILGILVGRLLGAEGVEIAAWNLFAICGLVFLAQGAGIFLYRFARWQAPAILKVLVVALTVVAVIAFLIPWGVAVLPAVLIILGIAENWFPMRTEKQDVYPA